MFQPGEEGRGGAEPMIAEGVLDAAGRRAGRRLRRCTCCSPMTRTGVFVGPARGADVPPPTSCPVTVRGQGGHGSPPHCAKDPIPAACEMVMALQTLVTRSFDIFDPVVVTVGSFHAGTAENIIPTTAAFEATVRSFSPRPGQGAARHHRGGATGIAAAHGLEVERRATSTGTR